MSIHRMIYGLVAIVALGCADRSPPPSTPAPPVTSMSADEKPAIQDDFGDAASDGTGQNADPSAPTGDEPAASDPDTPEDKNSDSPPPSYEAIDTRERRRLLKLVGRSKISIAPMRDSDFCIDIVDAMLPRKRYKNREATVKDFVRKARKFADRTVVECQPPDGDTRACQVQYAEKPSRGGAVLYLFFRLDADGAIIPTSVDCTGSG